MPIVPSRSLTCSLGRFLPRIALSVNMAFAFASPYFPVGCGISLLDTPVIMFSSLLFASFTPQHFCQLYLSSKSVHCFRLGLQFTASITTSFFFKKRPGIQVRASPSKEKKRERENRFDAWLGRAWLQIAKAKDTTPQREFVLERHKKQNRQGRASRPNTTTNAKHPETQTPRDRGKLTTCFERSMAFCFYLKVRERPCSLAVVPSSASHQSTFVSASEDKFTDHGCLSPSARAHLTRAGPGWPGHHRDRRCQVQPTRPPGPGQANSCTAVDSPFPHPSHGSEMQCGLWSLLWRTSFLGWERLPGGLCMR